MHYYYKMHIDHFMKKLLATVFNILLAFALLVAHTWQAEGCTVARTGLDRLCPSSVAVTGQTIGMLIPAHTDWHGP